MGTLGEADKKWIYCDAKEVFTREEIPAGLEILEYDRDKNLGSKSA